MNFISDDIMNYATDHSEAEPILLKNLYVTKYIWKIMMMKLYSYTLFSLSSSIVIGPIYLSSMEILLEVCVAGDVVA